MDYIILENFVFNYGLHAIVLSVIICVFRVILKVIFKEKIGGVTRSYIEMAFAVLIEFLYFLIFVKDITAFTMESISKALLSYSISLAIYSLTSRIFKGKTVKVNARTLIIESILSGYVSEDKLSSASRTIALAIEDKANKEQLLSLLADTLSSPQEDEEIIALLDLILSSVENVK